MPDLISFTDGRFRHATTMPKRQPDLPLKTGLTVQPTVYALLNPPKHRRMSNLAGFEVAQPPKVMRFAQPLSGPKVANLSFGSMLRKVIQVDIAGLLP